MSVTAIYDKATGDVEVKVELEASTSLTHIERTIAFQLCKIIKTPLVVEFEVFSENNTVELSVFKDNGKDTLGQYYTDVMGSFTKKDISDAVQSLYSQYVDANIDVKIDKLGL